MPSEIVLLVAVARGLIEVAGLMLLVRGFVWLFFAKARTNNVVYDLLTTGVTPFLRLTRKITPRFITDNSIPMIAFFWIFWIWVGLSLLHQAIAPGQVS